MCVCVCVCARVCVCVYITEKYALNRILILRDKFLNLLKFLIPVVYSVFSQNNFLISLCFIKYQNILVKYFSSSNQVSKSSTYMS